MSRTLYLSEYTKVRSVAKGQGSKCQKSCLIYELQKQYWSNFYLNPTWSLSTTTVLPFFCRHQHRRRPPRRQLVPRVWQQRWRQRLRRRWRHWPTVFWRESDLLWGRLSAAFCSTTFPWGSACDCASKAPPSEKAVAISRIFWSKSYREFLERVVGSTSTLKID